MRLEEEKAGKNCQKFATKGCRNTHLKTIVVTRRMTVDAENVDSILSGMER